MRIERKDFAGWMRDMDGFNFEMTWASWRIHLRSTTNSFETAVTHVLGTALWVNPEKPRLARVRRSLRFLRVSRSHRRRKRKNIIKNITEGKSFYQPMGSRWSWIALWLALLIILTLVIVLTGVKLVRYRLSWLIIFEALILLANYYLVYKSLRRRARRYGKKK